MKRLNQILKELKQERDKETDLRERKAKLTQEIERLNNVKEELKAKLTQEIERLNNVKEELESEEEQLKSNCETELRQLAADFEDLKTRLTIQMSWLTRHLNERADSSLPSRPLTLPWDHPDWLPESSEHAYQPQLQGLPPRVVRLGVLEDGFPALVPVFEDVSIKHNQVISSIKPHILLVGGSIRSQDDLRAAIQSIALRVISTFPARKLKAIFIDPVNMGSTFPFKDLHSFISGGTTFTSSEDIEDQLFLLTEHIRQVVQNYLGNDYNSLEEYNASARSVAEPYRYLFISDFPTNFNRKSLEYLKTILSNGARSGVNVVLHRGKLSDLDRGTHDLVANLIESSDYFGYSVQYKEQEIDFKSPHISYPIVSLDQPPQAKYFNKIVEAVNKAVKDVKLDTVAFSKLSGRSDWTEDSRREIRTAIGLKGAGAKDNLEFWLGENDDGQSTNNGLLAGKPGSGKSYTLHAIILGLARNYSPDELELYLLDFKEGVEFQIYANPRQDKNHAQFYTVGTDQDLALPHARVVSIESDREFGLSVLEYVNQQIEARGAIFKAAGNLVNKLQDYRDKTGEKMPRILVVIDEFQYLFQESDRTTERLNVVMENIARQGRAFGIHLLMASQSPNIQLMARQIYSQIDLRIVQQMDERTATSVLADGNTGSVTLLDRPGKVIYNRVFGSKNNNEIGQIANISAPERSEILNQIFTTCKSLKYKRPAPLIVFNGSEPTRLRQNRQLSQLSELQDWLSSRDLNKQVLDQKDWIVQEYPSVAWLGEAMRIGEHTMATFRRRPRSNMIVVGASEEVVFGILGGILVSLVHCNRAEEAEFKIIDLSMPDEDHPWSKTTKHFRHHMGSYFPINLAKRFPDEHDSAIIKPSQLLEEVYEELNKRLDLQRQNPDTLNFGRNLFFVYAFGNLTRAQNLRSVIGHRGTEEPSDDVKRLNQIINQGPELGIHTILWVEDVKTLMKLNGQSNPKAWLSDFDLRVGLTLPGTDSQTLFGSEIAVRIKNLERLRGYYHDESLNSGEKFKPYSILSESEIAFYAGKFNQRVSATKED